MRITRRLLYMIGAAVLLLVVLIIIFVIVGKTLATRAIKQYFSNVQPIIVAKVGRNTDKQKQAADSPFPKDAFITGTTDKLDPAPIYAPIVNANWTPMIRVIAVPTGKVDYQFWIRPSSIFDTDSAHEDKITFDTSEDDLKREGYIQLFTCSKDSNEMKIGLVTGVQKDANLDGGVDGFDYGNRLWQFRAGVKIFEIDTTNKDAVLKAIDTAKPETHNVINKFAKDLASEPFSRNINIGKDDKDVSPGVFTRKGSSWVTVPICSVCRFTPTKGDSSNVKGTTYATVLLQADVPGLSGNEDVPSFVHEQGAVDIDGTAFLGMFGKNSAFTEPKST